LTWLGGFGVTFDLLPLDAPPLALRKIRIVAEFEPFEIDHVPRRFGKIDAGEGHAHAVASGAGRNISKSIKLFIRSRPSPLAENSANR
jgi:hypothetical protein